jgi:hypothetical protein
MLQPLGESDEQVLSEDVTLVLDGTLPTLPGNLSTILQRGRDRWRS